MARRIPPQKVMYFEAVAPRRARNTIIVSTTEVAGRNAVYQLAALTIGARLAVADA
jgi:hypothetical protein